jgi:hypothetical protein
LLTFLKGYRTYIVAFIIALVAILHYLGYVDTTVTDGLVTLLGGAGLAALRAAVAGLPTMADTTTAPTV